jgi:hypothetical protein
LFYKILVYGSVFNWYLNLFPNNLFTKTNVC